MNWLNYIERSYEQIKAAILNRFQTVFPEVSDYSESNFWVRLISIWSGIAEMLGYYIDNAAREAHLSTCRLYKSAVYIAESYSYPIKNSAAAAGVVTVVFNAPIANAFSIPLGTQFSNGDGLLFTSTTNTTVPAGVTKVNVKVTQNTDGNNLSFTSDGTANQVFELPENTQQGTVTVAVAGVFWTAGNLATANTTALIFTQTVNAEKTPVIRFGDNFNGAVPAAGATIDVTIKVTQGAEGNVDTRVINTLESSLTLPAGTSISEVYNPIKLTGGSNIESLSLLKQRIPAHNRTNDRAITSQDYKDLALLVAGVEKAAVRYSCGKKVEIYIVPAGGGLASSILLENVESYIDPKKAVTTQIKAISAGQIETILTVAVTALPQYANNDVQTRVETRLFDFFSTAQQEIEGQVFLSDLYEVLETTEGVSNSTIEELRPIPYARILGGTTSLTWDADIQAGSNTVQRWRILMTALNTYQLFRGTDFLGNFITGTQYSFPELELTVTGSYTTGDQWEFYTYGFYGSYQLQEASIPVLTAANLSITTNGGV